MQDFVNPSGTNYCAAEEDGHGREREKGAGRDEEGRAQPLRPGEIAEKAAMDKAEVTKIIDKLKKEGKVSSPKRCFYAPA